MLAAALLGLAQVLTPPASAAGVAAEPGVAAAGAQDPAGQEAAPQDPGASREQARRWWEQLSPEEREQFRSRHEQFQRLGPGERQALRDRMEAVERHRRKVWFELDEAERARLEALPDAERDDALDQKVHERLRRRHEQLEGRMPPGQGFRGRPLGERLGASDRLIADIRGGDLQRQLEELHTQGWIGDQAAAWLAQAPAVEQAAALLDARKWRGLAEGRQRGWFEQWQLDEHEQRTLAEMPSRDFLIAIGELRKGIPKAEVFSRGGPGGPPPFPGEGRRRGRQGMRPGAPGERDHPGRRFDPRPDEGEGAGRPDRQRPSRGPGRRQPPGGGGQGPRR